MQRYGSLDYAHLAKLGFALGVAAFAAGSLGSIAMHAYVEPVPGWFEFLLFDLEVIGILVALFAPIVFGIVMPLTE